MAQRLCLYIRMAFAAIEDDQLQLAPRLAKRLLLLAQLYGVRGPAGIAINLELSQEDLSHMLGTARQAIGRQLRAWQQLRWITQAYKRITLHDEAALAALVEANAAG